MSDQQSRFKVEERAAQPYAYVSDAEVHAGNFAVIADRFGEVFGWLAERGIEPAGPVFFNYKVINMPGPMHVEAGVPIGVTVRGDDAVSAGELPAGRYVTTLHHGHPDGLMAATRDLLAWAEDQGLEFDQWDAPQGHSWACRTEWFFSDPNEVPDLNDWDTELAFKLK
ncbi:MAG TPA: GyrI-like domain-containing protein [Microlunatus sp.]|nr:GyrI-like domain-containing protein [Microlunatus sp.]